MNPIKQFKKFVTRLCVDDMFTAEHRHQVIEAHLWAFVPPAEHDVYYEAWRDAEREHHKWDRRANG